MVLAPMTVELTPGLLCTHVKGYCGHIGREFRCDLLKPISDVVVLAGWVSPAKAPLCSSIFLRFCRVYLPESAPILSGLQGNTPRPISCAMGIKLTLHRALQQRILGLKRDERCPTSEVRKSAVPERPSTPERRKSRGSEPSGPHEIF